MKVERVVMTNLASSLEGKTPQQVIRMMKNIIGRAKQNEKRRLRIQSYHEDYGHPFREPDTHYRMIVADFKE